MTRGFLLVLVTLTVYLNIQGFSALLRPTAELSSEYDERLVPAAQVRLNAISGDTILKRNPFDSKTGELREHRVEPPKPKPKPRPEDLDPLTAPSCEDITVSAVAELSDAKSSLAILRAAGDDHGWPRRVGDLVANKTIEFIGRNPLAQSPAVWLSEEGELCQAILFDRDRAAKVAGSTLGAARGPKTPPPLSAPPSAPHPVADHRRQAQRQLAQEAERSIHHVSDAEVHIDANLANRMIKEYANLTRGTKLVPAREDGRVVGLKLNGVEPEGLLARLGLKEGDQLEAINGFSLSTPVGAFQAYAALRKATDLQVNFTRAGRALSMNFRIR